MALPLKPPIKPQLARPAKELPEGAEWRYEPKWDGFRTIVFRDGDDVHLQSRNGRPMNRYFPEIVPQILSLPNERLVLDGELILVVDGIQEFDLLGQRIHSRRRRLPPSSPSTCSPTATTSCSSFLRRSGVPGSNRSSMSRCSSRRRRPIERAPGPGSRDSPRA